MDLKNKYLDDLHAFFRAYIPMYHQKRGGEHEFINSFIVNVSASEYNHASHDILNDGINTFNDFNKKIPEPLNIQLLSVFLNSKLEPLYIFRLYIEDIQIDLSFEKSKTAIEIYDYHLQDFDLITEEELESMCQEVKSQPSFVLLKIT
jgi:hypothetical protein